MLNREPAAVPVKADGLDSMGLDTYGPNLLLPSMPHGCCDVRMSPLSGTRKAQQARERIARSFRAHSGNPPPGKQKQKQHSQVGSDRIRLLIAVATELITDLLTA